MSGSTEFPLPGKTARVRDTFLWAAKCLKGIPHHHNPPLHSGNGLIGAFRGRSWDMNRLVGNQDLRLSGMVHHLDYPGIHVRFGGQPVGCKATETLTVPILVGKSPAMSAGQTRAEYLGLTAVEKRRQVGGHTHPPPVSPLRQPTHPPTHAVDPAADRVGGRLLNTRTGALSGSATEIKTPVPGDCLDEFPAVRSVGILGEESAVGCAPKGSAPHSAWSWGKFPKAPTQCHLPPDIRSHDDHGSHPLVMPAVS